MINYKLKYYDHHIAVQEINLVLVTGRKVASEYDSQLRPPRLIEQ